MQTIYLLLMGNNAMINSYIIDIIEGGYTKPRFEKSKM